MVHQMRVANISFVSVTALAFVICIIGGAGAHLQNEFDHVQDVDDIVISALEQEMAVAGGEQAEALSHVVRRLTEGESSEEEHSHGRRLIWQSSEARPLSECTRPLDTTSVVLITGAAGFIGHALGKKLADQVGTVIGIDDFNEYYSPEYKRARADDLRSAPERPRVFVLDVCNKAKLESLVFGRGVTHVVHLAAQAGVRYSKIKPETYVRQNLRCFLSLLEILREGTEDGRKIGFVWASSSSVYGDNTQMPFSEEHAVDRPNNLYGATKRANELMAQSYATLFGLHSVGLRFFTVYGPWGRPDMAGFMFVRSVFQGEPLRLFRKGDMIRDFTYIDDIVDGVIGAMKLCDSNMQVLNLGCADPVQLMDFVQAIETFTEKSAIIEDGGPGEGEIYKTYANVSKAEHLLGYSPKVHVREGVQRFVEWYSSIGPETIEQWYKGEFLLKRAPHHSTPDYWKNS